MRKNDLFHMERPNDRNKPASTQVTTVRMLAQTAEPKMTCRRTMEGPYLVHMRALSASKS